jgi:hypothetical protein
VDKDKVYLSRIFKWYKKDFPQDLLAYLRQYADPDLAQELQTAQDQRYRRSYRSYDWSLNTDQEGIGDGH